MASFFEHIGSDVEDVADTSALAAQAAAELAQAAAEAAEANAESSAAEAATFATNAATSESNAAASATSIQNLNAATGAAGSNAAFDGTTNTITVPRGDTGATGLQGPAGQDGQDGADSTVVGPQGPQGIQGIQGPAGQDGADSTVAGPQGPQGIQGPAGQDGADSTVAGPQGPAGAAGADSTVAGPQGPQGIQGVQGPAGQDGSDGAAGTTFDTNVLTVDGTNNRIGVNDTTPSVSLDAGANTDALHVPVGTTAQRPTGAAGRFRYNSSLAQFEGYTDAWGAIGGGGGTNTFTADSFTGNGSTTAYALSQTISSENNLLVFIEGIFQQQDAFSIATSGGTTTLTFSAAPANGNAILIYSIAAAVSGSNLNLDSMTGDGSDTTLALSIAPINENNCFVTIDGVVQSKSNYSVSGSTLTFSTAPPNGSAVEVMTMTQTDINVPADGTITSSKLSGDLVTPGALDVTGTATMDGLTVANTAVVAGDFDGGTAATYIRLQDDTDNFLFGSNNSLGNFLIKNETADALRLSVANTGDISFYEDTGTTPKLFWDASAESLGIGTGSPSRLVHLLGTSNPTLRLDNGTNSVDIGIATSNGALLNGSATNDLVIARNGAYNIRFGTNGNTRATIDASGNLLLGGTAKAEFFTTTGDSIWFLNDLNAAGTAYINYYGYNQGLTQFRSTVISNGKGASILALNGSTKAATFSGQMTSLPTYNNGSASPANMVVNSNGLFLRSVSSAKYKTGIEDVQDAYVDSLLQIRPVYYRSTLENDNPEHSHWGFIAEEVAEIDPRLVHYKTVDVTYSDDGEQVETKLETPEPEGVQYERFAPLMLKLIQKQQATIESQAAAITDLTTRLTALEN